MKIKILIIIISLGVVYRCIPGFCQGVSNQEIPGESIARTSRVDKSEDDETETKFISYIFKILAKGVIATTDLDNLKTKCIAKIDEMSEDDFRVRYHDFYEHFSSNRVSTQAYGFHNDMTKTEAIELLKSLDKNKISALIDALPDIFIANEFKRYSFKNQLAVPDSNNTTVLLHRLKKMITYLKDKYL